MTTPKPTLTELRQQLITELLHANFRTDVESLLDAYRDLVAASIVAGLAVKHDDPATAERYRPGLRMAMRNANRLATLAADVQAEG